MIGVIVPAHDEEEFLGACLQAVCAAAAHPRLKGEPVMTAVVLLDACTDKYGQIPAAFEAHCVVINALNVGAARRAGGEVLLRHGVRWLAFTDADSRAAPEWLAAQLNLQVEAVCGCVIVEDWSAHETAVRQCYEREYQPRDGHHHIHGANFGVGAKAYRRAGGFDALAVSEDVALVQALLATGCHIAWSAAPRVITSAKPRSRLRGGFADYLVNLAT